jgi:hypothetical protein
MSATAKKLTAAVPVFVMFGADEFAKPRAARFSGADAMLLAKAAVALSLCLIEVKDPDLAEIAKKLPAGRLHADGRGLVPFIKSELYEDLIYETVGRHGPSYDKHIPSGLPHAWDDIAPGNLVIAHETLENGWWEAIVIARDGDLVTLRYRDYPKYGKFVRHRSAVSRYGVSRLMTKLRRFSRSACNSLRFNPQGCAIHAYPTR